MSQVNRYRPMTIRNEKPLPAQAGRGGIAPFATYALLDAGGKPIWLRFRYRAGAVRLPQMPKAKPYGQRASRKGGEDVRVCQEPSGDWYFSPGLVWAISRQPEVSAYSSTVALLALALSA